MRLFSSFILVASLLGGLLSAQTLTDSLKFRYDLGTNYNDLGPTANHLQAMPGATHTFMGSGDARVLNCVDMNGSGGAVSDVASNKGWTQTAVSVWVFVATPPKGTTSGGWVLHGVEMGFGLTAVCPGEGSQPVYSVFFDGITFLPTTVTGGQPDGWHHLVAQNDGTTTTVYLDGQLQATASETLVPMASNNLPNAKIYVGQSGSTTTDKFAGKISTLKIYNRILTATEILTLSGNGPKRIYVSASASGSNNGTSWANAYPEFHTALINANEHDTLWVATGTYLPSADSMGDMNPINVAEKAFKWSQNLHLYGGFAGTESQLSQRPAAGRSTLSGDLAGNTDAKTVMYAKHLDASSLIDGFIFEKAVSSGWGGGLYCTLDMMFTIQNCEFRNNQTYRGAGLSASNNCHIVVKNCTFHDNSCLSGSNPTGAGVQATASNFFFQNCSFYNNTAQYGAGVELEGNASASPTGLPKTIFANCLFYDNTAGYWGSPAIYGYGMPTGIAIYNCTFANNATTSAQAPVGEAIGMNGGAYTAYNSIFWSNSDRVQLYDAANPNSLFTLENCIVKGGYSGTSSNNSGTYPAFADSAANDFRLTVASPAVNAGRTDTTGLLKWLGTKDLDGNGRFFASTIDMGCYESQTHVATDPARTSSIRVYPNPAHDLLTVETTTPGPVYVRDLTGKILMAAANSGTTTLDISELPAGMYLLQTSQYGTTSFIKK